MVKYCVANDILSMRLMVLPMAVISRYSNTCEEVKAPWYSNAIGLEMVISTYSNTC